MGGLFPHDGTDKSQFLVIDEFTRWSTRTFPHRLADTELYVADNAVWNRDGVISKRAGNANYGNAQTVAGAPVTGMRTTLPGPAQAIERFYPVGSPPQLLVESGGTMFRGDDVAGSMTGLLGHTFSPATYVTFEQAYDPDYGTAGATVLIMCDGVGVPQLYDGANPIIPVKTGTYTQGTGATASTGNYLPNGRSGAPITPRYVFGWKSILVYAGEPTEPTGLYLADALRPERFNGLALVDSNSTPYTAYFPAGRDGRYGAITGLQAVGGLLVIFFAAGIAVATNSGTYGAYQFQFEMISTSTGCPSPRSIVGFGGFVIFFGGDRFYATDGVTVQPFGDDIPSVYSSTSPSAFAAELRNPATMFGLRRSGQYWCAYDNVGLGFNTSVLVFDLQANGGYTFGAGGGSWTRWPTGMPLACGVECRRQGDAYQLFWGSSGAFTFGGAPAGFVAQYDVGRYDDFGAPIQFEARAKSFMLDKPVWPKTVQGVYVVATSLQPSGTSAATSTSTVTAYAVLDGTTSIAPNVPLTSAMMGAPATYDRGVVYDSGAIYDAANEVVTVFSKTYPQQETHCNVSFQPGVVEESTNAFNLLALVVDVTIDEPFP